MKWVWFFCIVIWICAENVCANFTFTYDMANKCKEHICKHGYFYETFYAVNDDQRKMMKSDPNIEFEMHIAILAASNGHILLSPVANPDATVPVYEFVVGGGGNKFTELRGNLKRNARASRTTIGVVSPIEFRAFYIKITEDGFIEFGREGDILPILSYQDMYPTEVHYFSFAAWNGVEAKFLYDCPIPLSNGSSVTPSSEEVEQQVSKWDKLKRTLLYNKNPYVPPRESLSVEIGVKVTSVYYNAYDAKLTTGLSIIRRWNDDSMAWNPSKFNDTSSIEVREGEIWTPTLSVFNTNSMEQLNSKNSEPITILNSGKTILHMQTTVNTWCYDYSDKMTKWPRDEYDCTIVLEPWEINEHILFKMANPDSSVMKVFTDVDEVIQNEWEVTIEQYVINASTWNLLHSYNSTHQCDRFIISLDLKRRATSYNIVFYTPLLALVSFVLLSFWSEPLSMKRVWFYAYCTVIICMGMCFIDFLIPCHSVPTILILYLVVLGGVLLALIIQVALMTSLAQRLCKTPAIQSILSAQWFRSLFCLPPLKVCQIYETIEECYDDESMIETPRNGAIEEMQSDKTEHSETKELTEALDKFMFIIYSVVFAVMLTLHF